MQLKSCLHVIQTSLLYNCRLQAPFPPSPPLCAGGRVTPLFPNHQDFLPSHHESRYLHFQQHHQNVPATGKLRNTGGDLPQPLKVPALPHSCRTIHQHCFYHSLTSKALELGTRAHIHLRCPVPPTVGSEQDQPLLKAPKCSTNTAWL